MVKTRVKGVLALALILILALVLGACGGTGTTPDAADHSVVAGGHSTAPPDHEPSGGPDTGTDDPISAPEPGRGNDAAADPAEPAPAPAPQAAPSPSAPDVTGSAGATAADTCTLSVDCRTIRADISRLNPEKTELVPADGVILSARTVEFQAGESVFTILQRELKCHRIHFEFVNTPMYDSAYIKGINNLYEGDCGPLSGWTYRVNGQLPSYGVSQYQPASGDVIEILYSCDLGRDVDGDDNP